MTRQSLPLLGAFGAALLVAVLIGAWIGEASGLGAQRWLPNLAAWFVGGLAALGIATAARHRLALEVALWAAPLGLLATLLSAGHLGVHRWVNLGPAQVNVAMVLLPIAIVAVALSDRLAWRPWVPAIFSVYFLGRQPDRSQATALALVLGLVALASLRSRPGRLLLVLVLTVGCALLAWLEPDPLAPVAAVELIVARAFSVGPVLGFAAVFALAAVAAVPPALAHDGPPATPLAGIALGLLIAAWAAAPSLGAFPVPFVGVGMSPILGAWLGAGLLAGRLSPENSLRRTHS